jgi:DNA-binding NtrC family response regulator
LAEGAPILVVDDHPNTLAEVSLIITDGNTPQIDGLNLLNSVKKISPRIPVIIMTANGSVNNAVEAMQAGAADYLLKPFSPESLEKTVTRALGGSNSNGRSKSTAKKSGSVAHGKEIATQNRTMLDILKQARGVAPSSATVLIRGESGTGKELLAAYVHQHSRHPEAPYVALNCAALPDTLAESEMFGHEKGSFTGAVGRKIGKFELAQKGTVVLDEISEMPLPLQAKLLRVLQEREVDRIGGTRPVPIDARVVAISNVDLKNAVSDGKFREDLYYRINVIPLTLPPLRERRDDIELLTHRFMEKFNRANHKEVIDIDKAALDMLLDHDWKGNVRELENVIERAVLIADGPCVKPEHLLLESSAGNSQTTESLEVKSGSTVRQMEKKLIYKTLKEVDDNRTQAAELLGISIRTLRNKLHEYKAETSSAG